MRVRIDHEKCAMSGECVYNHPELFAFDDDDLPRVLVDVLVSDDHVKGARQAREVCPGGAIELLDD
ncbi:MAG: 4Fe-4S single cluster domain [Actinomycetota bacterium]|jgi:ferredoxin